MIGKFTFLKTFMAGTALWVGASAFAQTSIAIDFEDASQVSNWVAEVPADVPNLTFGATVGTSSARSGTNVLKLTGFIRNSGFHIKNTVDYIVVQPDANIHALVYGGASLAGVVAAPTYSSAWQSPTPGTWTDLSTTDVSVLIYDGSSRLNTSGAVGNVYPRVRFKPGADFASVEAYFDDFVLYTDNNVDPDFDAPMAAADFAASSSTSFAFTAGTDALSGVAQTLIFRTDVASPEALSLMNQKAYAVNTVVGDWTVIAVEDGATSSYTDATGGTMYEYAIVVRDLAFNYSAPLLGNTGTTDINSASVVKFNCFNVKGGIELNTLPIGVELAVYNLSGIKVYGQTITSSNLSVALANGMYIVRVADGVRKVVVK